MLQPVPQEPAIFGSLVSKAQRMYRVWSTLNTTPLPRCAMVRHSVPWHTTQGWESGGRLTGGVLKATNVISAATHTHCPVVPGSLVSVLAVSSTSSLNFQQTSSNRRHGVGPHHHHDKGVPHSVTSVRDSSLSIQLRRMMLPRSNRTQPVATGPRNTTVLPPPPHYRRRGQDQTVPQ